MTKVPDSIFPLPDDLNTLPCVSASRLLERVPEVVKVISCCQDSEDPSLVIITFGLSGVFEFMPFCNILSVDGVETYRQNNIQAPLARGHRLNPPIPITTQCQTITTTIVFDFGLVIPNFLSTSVIVFQLGMVGTLPLAFGIHFDPQTPTFTFTWTKGVLPRPIGMTLINGIIHVEFEYGGNLDCSCQLDCITPQGSTQDIIFCPNQKQIVALSQGDLNGDPVHLVLSLQDSLGNTSTLDIQGLINVVPNKPILSYGTPKYIKVTIPRTARNGELLENTECRVYKYTGSDKNIILWKDWDDSPTSSLIDVSIVSGKTYGYAVVYRGEFSELSKLSDWATITIP